MARRKKITYYRDDTPERREQARQAGIASQRPDVLIRRLARMDLTDEQRQRLADIGAGLTLAAQGER